MARYILRRLVQAIPVLIGITIVVYAILLAAPGGPTARFANNPRMTQADKDRFKRAWGLDQPVPIQYCRWMGFCNPDVDGYSLSMFVSEQGMPQFFPAVLGGGTNGAHPRRLRACRSTRGCRSRRVIGRAIAAHPHPGGHGARDLDLPGAAHRRGRRRQALLAVRPVGHRVRLRRLCHAHLLAGADADLHLRRAGPRHPACPGDGHHASFAGLRLARLLGVLHGASQDRARSTSAATSSCRSSRWWWSTSPATAGSSAPACSRR